MSSGTQRIFATRASALAPGAMCEVPLTGTGETPVNALVANIHGKFFATSSRCTHYGMPLARGVLTGDGRLYCPFHGACFRMVTGDIEDAPAIDPLKRIDVTVEGDDVFLHVNLEELAKPHDGVCEKVQETKHHTVIIGGGAVAISCAQELRRHAYGGRITIISAEPHVPIDRPKLSKGSLPPMEKLVIRDEKYIRERLKVDLILSTRVFAIDTHMKRVSMQGNGVIPYDTLVLGTGSIPRRLPIEGARLQGVYLMRSLEDAEEIHHALNRRPQQNLIVIGTGFIGLEMGVAYGKRANITLIGQTHVPLEGPLGREVGYGVQTTLVNERPIKFLNAVDVVRIEADATGDGVSAVTVQPRARGAPELTLPADLVLMSAGAIPATGFLRNSPTFPQLRRDSSVEVDSALRVIGVKDVFAGGDIVSYPTMNGFQRIEHWNVACNHGREIGRTIATGQPRVFSHVPVFWSGLGSTLRYAGNGLGYDRVHVLGEPDEAEFTAFYGKEDNVIAVSSCVDANQNEHGPDDGSGTGFDACWPYAEAERGRQRHRHHEARREHQRAHVVYSSSTTRWCCRYSAIGAYIGFYTNGPLAMSTPPTASPLVLSAAEQPVFAQLYSLADPSNSGVVTGDAAVGFFEGFRLPTLTLGQIWSIADSDNNGFLTPNTFGVALRLIARAQRGESVSEAVVNTPGAPPTYHGLGATQQEATDTILPEDRARFARIFAMSGPRNGLLSGEQAKEIFLKSKLPYDTLGNIWNLADTKARGALDLADFAIGMHYIQGTMNGTILNVPAVLPPGLYEQAAGGTPAAAPTTPAASAATPAMSAATPAMPAATPSMPPVPPAAAPLRAQTTGASSRQSSFAPAPAVPATPTAPLPTQTSDWGVSAAEKAKADGFFDTLDTSKTGSLDGPFVVPFFLQSGLDETTLAHVWDLSDVTQSGSLTRDEFAVAMKLITDKLAGQELPQTLPQNLQPPALRQQSAPAPQPSQRSETQRELFSLIDDDAPQVPAASAAATFTTPAPQLPQQTTGQSSIDDGFFAPGGGAAAAMGLSPTASRAAAETRSQPIADTGAEFGNTKIQLESTNKSLGELGTRRADAEAASTRGTTTLAELSSQLERARASHATESEAVTALEAKVNAQAQEIETLRQDVIRAESDLSALRTNKDELEQKLLGDRETARELRQRLTAIQSETASLKESHEALTRDAQHQASLNAVSNKQLQTALEEQERMRTASTPSGRRTNPFERIEAVFGAGAGAAVGATAASVTRSATPSQASGTTTPLAARGPAPAPPVPVREQSTGPLSGLGVSNAPPLDPRTAPAAVPNAEESSDGHNEPESAEGYNLRQREVTGEAGEAQDSFRSALTGNGDLSDNKDPVPGSFPAMPGGLDAMEKESAPPANIPTSRTIDDFDSAFENMGVSSVVHGTPGGTRARDVGFDNAFEGFNDNTRVPIVGTTQDAPRVVRLPNSGTSDSPAAPISTTVPAGTPKTTSMPWSVGAAPPVPPVPAAHAPAPATDAVPGLPPTGSTGSVVPGYPPSAGTATDAAAGGALVNAPAASAPPAGGTPARVPTPPRASDSTQVRQLCNMGFSRSAAVSALEHTGNRMERALEHILAHNAK